MSSSDYATLIREQLIELLQRRDAEIARLRSKLERANDPTWPRHP